jgi:hypothetical protein
MTATLLALVMTVAALLGQAAGPPRRPDFSGHWVMVAPAELAARRGQEQRVTQDAAVLTVAPPNGNAPPTVYRLDGSRTELPLGGGVKAVSIATWEGDTLRIVTEAQGRTSTAIWSLDADGLLTIEASVDQPPMSMTMVFKKKGA